MKNKNWKEVIQTIDEARKANTLSARKELSKRPSKPLTGADAEKKKKESDAAWERLMAYAAAKRKDMSEAYGRDAYQRDHDSSVSGFGRRRREDDEYHVPDPTTRTHKIVHTVSKDGGEKHNRMVTISNSTKSHEEAKSAAKAHLEKQGYTVHESVSEGAYEKAEDHLSKANDAEREGRMKDFHTHMADHHEAMSEWHESKGRSASADKHAEKADMHHEKSLTVKEDAELEEVSKELANRYMHAAFSDRRRTDDKMMDLQNKQKGVDKFFSNHKKITKLLARSNKRTTGISRALDRLQKEGTTFQSSARLRLADALRKEREKREEQEKREAERIKQDVTKPQDKA